MDIGFIGAGKVGTSFGWYLKDRGFSISGYYSKTLSSSEKASEIIECEVFKDVQILINSSEIIFITTKDGDIENVSKKISQMRNIENKIFVHMSGALSSEIMHHLKEKGAFCYSLHPLQVFSDISSGKAKLDKTYFSLEGDKEKIDQIEDMLKILKNKYFIISKKNKVLYHAAACVFSNYITSTMWLGEQLLEMAEINCEEKMLGFQNLIFGAIEDSINRGCSNSLTGPISRGDFCTIEKHLASIDDEEIRERYKEMGRMTLELATINKLKSLEEIHKLKKILGDVNYEG